MRQKDSPQRRQDAEKNALLTSVAESETSLEWRLLILAKEIENEPQRHRVHREEAEWSTRLLPSNPRRSFSVSSVPLWLVRFVLTAAGFRSLMQGSIANGWRLAPRVFDLRASASLR